MSVGYVNKIDPAFLVEEKLEYLIIGDVIEEEKIPSPELLNWLVKFSELCKKRPLVINSISSYWVTSEKNDMKPIWIKFFRDYNLSIGIFPPVLQLKLKEGGLNLEKNGLKSVKDYSNEFIEFLINNKKRGI